MQYSDFNSYENPYPAVIFVPQLSTLNNTQLELNFNLFFSDLLTATRNNTNSVYNETLEVAKDFVSYFADNENVDWSLEGSATVQPFEEKFDDSIIAGWVLNCTAVLPFNKSVCDIPLKNEL